MVSSVTQRSRDEKYKTIMLEMLSQSPRSLGEFTRRLRRSERTVRRIIDQLRAEGYSIIQDTLSGRFLLKEEPRQTIDEFPVVPYEELYGDSITTVRSVDMGDTHFGCLQDQPHLIPIINNIAQETEADHIVHCGDVVNGNKHPGMKMGENDLVRLSDQIGRAVQVLKQLELPTWIRDGNHDRWAEEAMGFDVVEDVVLRLELELLRCGKESRFHHVDDKTHFQFDRFGVITELVHPNKGKTKARSYAPQNLLEGRLGEFLLANDVKFANLLGKPHVMKFGHWHCEFIFFQAGILFVLVPALQGPTTFSDNAFLDHQYGCWVTTIQIHKEKKYIVAFSARYYDFMHLIKKRTKKRDVRSSKKTNA